MDLLDIVSAKTIEELKSITYTIKNLFQTELDHIFAYNKNLEALKKDCFNAYKRNIISRNRYYYNEYGFLENNLKYIEYIKQTSVLTNEEIYKLEEMKYIKDRKKLIRFITKNFHPNIIRDIFNAQVEYMTIEKEGIKITEYDYFVKLAKEVEKYDIINCDEITSYHSFVTYDGRYSTYRLKRALDFAHRRNKQLRLDAVIFYMDTPEWVYQLRKNIKNSEYIFNHILGYVSEIINTVNEFNMNHNTNIVETITLLNEPINRFPGPFEARYSPRNEVGLHLYCQHSKWLKDDNLRPGWLRLLTIEQICKLGTYIKTNSNIKIMINECYLECYKKMETFLNKVIYPIQEYEKKYNVKIIDVIGTQIHTDVDTPICDIEQSFETLFSLKLPLEVTELDVFVSPGKIKVASHYDITLYKSWYMHDLYKIFNNYASLLQCITIWSISDSMNFMLSIINDKIYKENIYREKHNIKTKQYEVNVLGGYYDSHMNERLYIPEIGYE